jgi:TatD DNase family protein
VIDTHAHLDALDDVAEALQRARAAGIDRVVAIGSGFASARATRAIAEREEGVYVVAGVHPHQAADDEDPRRVVTSGAVAVGEIGLDYFRDYAPRDAQRRVFSEQLELASELEKPVVVHSRAAGEETAELLAGFTGPVILHCFSSPDLLPVALERGYYVSFAGNVTYPKAEELRFAAAAVPLERILAETDCPYLAPQPVRGRRNEPAYVVHTVAALAETRGEDASTLAAQIEANAVEAFQLA